MWPSDAAYKADGARLASTLRRSFLEAVGTLDRSKQMIGLTEQELQLIEMLREWGGKENYRMVIEVRDGGWDAAISRDPHGQNATVRGTGNSFNEAWDDMIHAAM